MGALQQLSLLIWKDIRLRIRAPVLTVISVIWPIAVFAAVAIIRSDFPPEQHTNCYYNAKAMPSSGAVDFMQSYMCDLETACIPGNSSTIESNEVPSYTGASISAVFDSLEPLISNENVTKSLNGISGSIEPLMELADGLQAGINITNVDYRVGDLFKNESHVAWFLESKIQLEPDVVDAFLNSFINVNELLDITGYVDFYRITCNETELQKYLDFPRGSDVRKISQELCRINITSIPEIIGEFQEQLNIEYLVLQIARFTSAISGNEWYDWVAAIEDALNVLVKLDAFPELQELIRGLGNSYDMLIAVRDGLKLFQDMQSGDIEDDTIKRLFEMMDSLFGDEEWWMNMKSNIEPFLDFLYETEEKRNGTRLEDLYRDGVLEMILDDLFGDVIDVKEGFKNASINFGKLLSLFEDETGWDELLNVCNDTSSFTELLEFDEMVDVQSIQEALCMNNVTQFWVDLISGMDVILIAKKTKEHLSTLKEGELDWQLILHSLFNLTGMDDLPSFLNVDLEALKYILDDDMTQAFMEIFEILSNTPVEEWFSAETIGYCLSILDGAFSNQTWWNEIKYDLGDGIRLGDTPIDRLLGNNSTFKLLDMYLNHTHFVIDALRDSTLHLQKIMALFSDTANHTDIWMVAHMICQNEIDISDFITFEPSVDEHEFLMEICSINFTMIFDEPNKHEDIMELIEQIIELSNYSKDYLGLRLIFEDVLSKIDELPQEVFALFYVIQAYQSGDIEMLFDMLIPKDGLSSGNILNGTMTSWLNSTFYQVDQELIHLINAVIVSLNDIHDAFKENVFNVCPEFDAETVTSCDYLCESHVECGTDQICCVHGCGTTCIDEDSPELRKFIDGSFGLLEELSRFHSNGSLSQSQLSMIIMELVSLQYDSFLCNTTAIGTVVGPIAAVDLSSHLDTICSVNITALFLEIQKEINMEQIESLIGIIFFGMPPPYHEERVSFEEFVQNIEKLAGNVLTAPEIFQELDGRYNITVEDLLNLLSVFSMQMDFDPMDIMDMSDIGELIMAYMGNNTTFQEWYYEFLRNVQIKDYISSLSIKYIPHLYGLEISIPTFEGILVNATETRKLIQVSFILPEVVDLILSLTNDQEKMMEFFSVPFPFMYLCETGTFNDYFTLSNMSKTDVELVQDTLCSINASLIKAELAELIDLDEIMHELSVLSNKSIEPQPFNLTEQIILQEHVNAVYATLAMYPPQIRVDEKWLETTLANLTAVTDLWLAEMEGNTMNYEMTLEQLSMMFANESWYKDLQKQLGLAVSINSALNDQLLKLVNGTIDLPKLESLFKDESEIRDFLELSDVLPEIVDVFLSLTISPSKFIELLAMEDPFTVLCEEGSFDETFMLPPDSTTDLGEVEEAICKINMTVLQYQLLDVFGITDALMQDKEADFQTHLATAMELSETIQTLIANPPKVEVDFEWLEKTLEELETVYNGWIESLFNQIDTVEDLENLQALLESLIESEDVESIRNISVVITQILAHLNGEIYDLPGQNLTFADIFPPATAEYLEVVLDQTSNIIGLQLGSEIDTQAFMEFLMNETDPLIAFCSDVAVLKSFVTVVEGVNVTELHTALCSLDLPTLEAEWGNIFATYSQLLEPQSSFNLTASSIVVSQFITSVAALIENPPNLEMLNEEWIDSQLNDILEILNDLEDEWTGELNISTNLLKLLRNQRGMHLGDELSLIFHTTNAYIEFINQELEELIGTNKTFVELLITSLTDYLEAEGVEEDVIKAIENATYIPGMIIKAYIENNLITSLCGDQEILFTLLQFEENVDVDRVQEMLCSVDLQAWLNSTNSLLDLWSMEFSKNIDVNATFDLVEFHANVEKLLSNIKAILENPPMFHVGIDPEDINFQSILELLGNYSMEIKHLNLTDVLELLGEFSDEDFLEGMSPMLKHVTEILMLAITDPDELEQLVKETLMEMIESNEWTEQNITHAIIDNLLLIYKFAQIENSDKWKHIMCNQSTFIEMFDLTDSVDVSVLQRALCNLSTEVLFRNASAYYGFDVLESIHKIDGFLSVLFNESAIDFDAIQELLAIVELIKPIVSDGNLADLEETLHEIIALLNTPVNELNVTRLHDLLSSLSNSNVSELINGYIHTAMELQEMYSSGNISLTNIVDDVEQYFEDAGLQEQVQPYIEIYNLILESIIKQTEDRGKTLIGLFNTSVPIETLNEQMNVPIEELKTSILSQFISVYQLASIYNHGAWDDVFCNATTFDETFNILDVFDSTAIQQIMCRMNTTAFFIHASNAHNIDILQFTAQIDKIIYQTSPMTPLEDTEWSEVVERTQEVVELLSWLSMLYGSPDMGDYYEIMARLEALQQQQTAQHIGDLMQIIEDFLPYLNDFPWMMDMMNSSGNVMDMIGLPNFQNISSSMICDMVEMLPMNNTLYEMIHGMIVQMDVVMVVARHSILQLPEKMEEMEALLANTDATLELGTVLIDTWPGLMNSLPVVLMDTDQFNLMSYIYSNYDQFEGVLCEEGLLKFVFGIDESVDLGYLVTTMCSLHKIRETEFVQEMYKMIDATTLIKDIEEVSTRPFNCSVFSSDIERFLYDAITVSGNLTSLLTDGEWILEEYLGDIFEFMAYLSQLSNDEVDGLTSIISLIEQFSGSSTDLLKIIIELFEDYEMPQDNSTEILVKLADILKNSTEFAEWLNETLNVSPEFIEQILEVFVDADVLSDLDEYDGDIYDLLCNESMFGDIFTFTDSSSDLMYSELCSEENHEIIEQIYKSIDILKLIREMKNETEHSSLLEDLANLFRLSLNISDENLEELFKIPTEVQNGISSVYELVEIISTGSEFSDIFKSVDKVLDDLSPIFGENELYQQVAAFIDALENLGFIRNLLGELPTFKFGNMFHDVDKVEEYLINELGLSEQSAEDLLQSFVILENILDLEYIDSLSSAFCDEDQIDMLLTFPPNTSMSDISEISETLCGLDPEVFLEFGEFLYKELDVAEIVIDIVTFSINDQIANATESVQKVNELVNQLQDALPALSSTMNISMLIPDDILEDLMGTVSAQTANEVLQVFVCGATVEDVENSPSRRRREAQHETHMKRRDAGSSAEMSGMKKIAKVIQETVNNGRHKRATQGDYISGAKTKYCDDLYRYINNNGNNGVIAWTYLKPILLGKIPYSPNSPAAQKIVKEASYMFDEIKGIRDFSAAWLVGSKELSTFNSDDYEDLLELLDNTFVQDLLVQQANIDAESLTSILENGVGLTTEEIEEINLLAEFIVNITDCIELDRFVGYDTEDDMVAAAESLYDSNDLFAAVRFLGIDDATEVPHHVAYKIRVEIDNTPSTEIVKDYLWRPGPNNNFHTDQQYQRVFIIVQDMLDRGIINLHAGDTAVQPTTYVQQMPYPCYQEDEFAYYITYAIPIFLTIAFIVIIAVMSYSQVYEKENGLEEAMMIMGLKSKINTISWFIVNFFLLTLLAISIAVILRYGEILSRSDVLVIFVFLECFLFSVIMLSYMVGSMCQRPNIASLVGALVYSISFLPVFILYLLESELELWMEIALCLLSPSAFCYGCEMLSRFEEQVVGASWSNFDTNPLEGAQLTFGVICAIMVADGLIYFIIGWYIKNVFPGTYGIGKPWYFPLTLSYWCGCSCEDDSTTRTKKYKKKKPIDSEADMEPEPTHLPLGVSCVNLTKKYKRKKTLAVDNFSFNFYEGQVSVLLGHNGAGKTTLMSMLTGFYSSTSGDAYVGEYNIKKDAKIIRGDLGFCPQHDALYDNLTVKEHLRMYGILKGVSESRIEEETKLMLETLEMTDMLNQLAKNLSGGMKRKLCVAIAFFAGSKVVILDEPTSGVDPNARRAIWDLISQYKEGRTIILCTHFMDEADVLGDRIAFMDHGRLKCCGSPMFLKYKYGSGYKLTLVKETPSYASTPSTTRASSAVTPTNLSTFNNEPTSAEDSQPKVENEYIIEPALEDQQSTSASNRSSAALQSSGSNGDVCDTEAVTQFIGSYIEGAKLSEDISSELSYNLPIENGQAEKFETFFNVLDAELENLHVTSYGISNATLDEVFFKICGTRDEEKIKSPKLKKKKPAHEEEKPKDNWAFNHEYSDNSDISFRASNTTLTTPTKSTFVDVDDAIRITGILLVLHQFQAVLYKRFNSARRDIKAFFWSIIFPALLIAVALLIKDIRPTRTFPSLRLDPAMFESPSYLFFSNGDLDDPFVNSMTDSLVYKPGIGTSCMTDDIDTSEYPCIIGQPPELASETENKFTAQQQDRDAPPCSCSDGYSICPDGAGGATPPSWQTNTTTYLQDLSFKQDINEYLLRTSGDFVERRYIGVTFDDIKKTTNGMENVARAWYDNNGLHALPTSLNVLNNVILRASFPRSTAPTYGITAYNHPLKFTKSYVTVDALLEAGINYGISMLILCAFSMIPATFIMYLVSENLSGTKRLHYVSGMPRIVYILSNIFWDLLYYLVPVGITLLIVYLFDTKSFASTDNLPAFATLLVLYGWAVIPVMYITVRLFKDSGTAFITLFCANIFIALLTNLPLIIKELFPNSDHENIYEEINRYSLIFPQYCLAGGLTTLIYNQMEADMYTRFGIDTFLDPFSKDMLFWNYVSLAAQGMFFLIIAILLEYFFICNCNCGKRCMTDTSLTGEDEDVRLERERVMSGAANDAMVKVKNLKKVYRTGGNKIVAVDSLCVGIQKGECFGLLGVNGAGKTTTFKILTGDIEPTAGKVSINKKSRIGYCPQKDAVCDLTTGKEMLVCYGLIKGMSSKEIKKVVPVITKRLGMDNYINRQVNTYSGGMKRSLSTAISLIGNPNIVFLDEPTTGMDPGSRRKVWKMISSELKAGKSVVLTSHSMEECEALCTRLAIMVNGKFKCIGSPQHVKSRFGDNFTIIIRGTDEQAVRQITAYFIQHYPTAVLKECHLNLIQYELPMKSATLADIFGKLEHNKRALMIEDYSVTQTSLEQVFLNFASKQTDGIEEPSANVYDNFAVEAENV